METERQVATNCDKLRQIATLVWDNLAQIKNLQIAKYIIKKREHELRQIATNCDKLRHIATHCDTLRQNCDRIAIELR